MKKLYLLPVFVFIHFSSLLAQWDGNPATVNNPVSRTPGTDVSSAMVSDGNGGVIVAWLSLDEFLDSSFLYIQRKSQSGSILWQTAAKPPLAGSSDLSLFISDLIPDGTGGAYLSWFRELTDTTTNIFLQHFNSNGIKLMGPNGIQINQNDAYLYTTVKLCTYSGGVIATWDRQLNDDSNIPLYAQVFAQKYNTAGVAQWTANGVPVSLTNSFRATPNIISDGNNGAFISFPDSRNSSIDVAGDFTNIDIFAQNLSSTGSRLWGDGGLPVTTAPFNQFSYSGGLSFSTSMISDGNGGFILAYEDYRNDNDGNGNIYLQRLNGNGTSQWATNGVAVSGQTNFYKNNLSLVSDGANGAIASWSVFNNVNFSGSLYGQRITGAGAVNWTTNGKLVSPANSVGLFGSGMAADGAGNYVFTWDRLDNVTFEGSIKAQKLNSAGTIQWAAGGVNICTNPDASASYPSIAGSSGSNDMIIIWQDQRNTESGSDGDIYSAKVGPAGTLIGSAGTSYTTTANGNWDNAGTWMGNNVPPAGADVIIRHNVIGNVNVNCNSIRVQSPGSFNVNPGIIINILK